MAPLAERYSTTRVPGPGASTDQPSDWWLVSRSSSQVAFESRSMKRSIAVVASCKAGFGFAFRHKASRLEAQGVHRVHRFGVDSGAR